MAISFSLRFSAAVTAALLLSLALPAISNAHGGEIHGDREPDVDPPNALETVTPAPAELSPSDTSKSPTESSTSHTHTLTPPSLLQRSRLMATTLWQAQPLKGGEIVGAVIFTAPFALTSLKRRAQAKTALR